MRRRGGMKNEGTMRRMSEGGKRRRGDEMMKSEGG